MRREKPRRDRDFLAGLFAAHKIVAMTKRSARARRPLSTWLPYVGLAVLAVLAFGVAALALSR